MTERPALDSFIVRIYRVDTEDSRKIAGLLEAMDGSGKREAFTDIDELCALLNRSVNALRKGRRRKVKSGCL
jgi:hypothetical protein